MTEREFALNYLRIYIVILCLKVSTYSPTEMKGNLFHEMVLKAGKPPPKKTYSPTTGCLLTVSVHYFHYFENH